jgi:GTP cyclohydrolase I
MGALEEGHYIDELEENDVQLVSESESEPGFESDKELQEAVRVLLEGIGEDCGREGLKRTPHRVAKAFREGTKGTFSCFVCFTMWERIYVFSYSGLYNRKLVELIRCNYLFVWTIL